MRHKLYAFFSLATHAAVHWIKLVGLLLTGRRTERGLALFLTNFLPDGITPLSAAEARHLPSFERCLACQACDPVCPLVLTLGQEVFPGPSYLAACLSRSMPQFPAAREYLEQFTRCGDCRACEEVCPSAVPLREIASFMNLKLPEIASASKRG